MVANRDLAPHRPPFLLIDRVLDARDGKVRAEKLIGEGDPLSADGLPELLLVEALAQAAACLRASEAGAHRGVLVAATGFEFHGRPQAGDRLLLSATRTATLGALHRFDGEASVDGRLLARGQLTFALEGA
jgi:3-hydroxyacyl-[acyl-carrier-protein] dehydratase